MRTLHKSLLLLHLFFILWHPVVAQVADSTTLINDYLKKNDSTVSSTPAVNGEHETKHRDPVKAMWRSVILPGWGQVYNKKIWKVPLVHAGLGIAGGLFVYNLKWFKRFQYAHSVAFNIQHGTDSITGPAFARVHKKIKQPFFLAHGLKTEALESRMRTARQDMDYAAVCFIIGWALNVIDATVDVHLSSFDVGPGLSLKVQPFPDPAHTMGMGLAVRLK